MIQRRSTRNSVALFLASFFLGIYAFAVGPAKIEIVDTLYRPDGALLTGTLRITNKTFTSVDGFVVQASETVVTVTNGALDLFLVPTAGGNPTGQSYTVKYYVSNQLVTEVWTVPGTGPTNLLGVRALSAPLPVQMLAMSQVNPPVPCLNGQAITWQTATQSWLCANAAGGGGTVPSGTGFTHITAGVQDAIAKIPRTIDLSDFNPSTPTTSGKIPIWDQPSLTYIPGDPLVQGLVPDGSTTAANPVAIGGYDTAGTPALHRAIELNSNPAGSEYGIVTRPIPSGTQAVSAASLPLPSGAATSAKQPALGTAGSASADVITVQGIASGTPLKTDSSATTQPVNGTVTANVGTTNGLALDATLTGGSAKSQGNVASGTSDSGNPIKMGGVFNTTQPTVTTGQRVDEQMTARGAQIVAPGVDNFATQSTLQAGSAIVGKVTTDQTTHGTTDLVAADVTKYGGSATSLGQKTMASSLPVTVASDQGAVPVSGTVTAQQATGTNLHMVCDSGCSSSAGLGDSATFTPGTTVINPAGGLFDDTPPTAIATGKAAAARITNNRALHMNLRNQAGTEIGTSSNPVQVSLANTATNATAVKVDGSAVTQPVNGTVTSNIGTTNGLALDATLTGGSAKAQGNIASAATDSGNPVKTGGVFNTTQPTVTTGQRVDQQSTARGAQIVAPGIDNFAVQATLQTGSAVAGKFGIDQTTPGTTNGVQVNAALPAGTNLLGKVGIDQTTPGTTNGVQVNAALPAGVNNIGKVTPSDGTNNATFKAASTQAAAGDTSQVVQLNPNQPSLTVPLNTSDSSNGSVTPGSTGAKSSLAGCQFTFTLPSMQNGQQVGVPCDQYGRPLVTDSTVVALLNQLVMLAAVPGKPNAGFLRGSFGRPVTSTGDAIDVNVKYPAATNDPCPGPTWTPLAVSVTANTVLVPGQSRPIVLCGALLLSSAAETFSIVEGTGSNCGTNTLPVIGGTTAANGPSAAANGGFVEGNGGTRFARQKVAGNDLCILISGSTLIAGNLSWAY
jgi:hypothetical protein